MLDTRGLISNLKVVNKHLGFNYSDIDNAIKVVEMWEELKDWYVKDQNLLPPHKRDTISDIIDYLENKHFLSYITQGYKIKIQGKSMEEVQTTANFIRDKVEGVKEVRMHDKD